MLLRLAATRMLVSMTTRMISPMLLLQLAEYKSRTHRRLVRMGMLCVVAGLAGAAEPPTGSDSWLVLGVGCTPSKDSLKELPVLFSFNDQDQLSKESEEALLYRDMQSDAVQQLVRRLQAVPKHVAPAGA